MGVTSGQRVEPHGLSISFFEKARWPLSTGCGHINRSSVARPIKANLYCHCQVLRCQHRTACRRSTTKIIKQPSWMTMIECVVSTNGCCCKRRLLRSQNDCIFCWASLYTLSDRTLQSLGTTIVACMKHFSEL